MTTATVAGVILAAGRGTRLGGPKAHVQVAGVSMLERCVACLEQTGVARIVVVVGPDAPTKAMTTPSGTPMAVRINRAPERGPCSSLQVGLHAIDGASRIVMLPVDFPLVRPDDVRRLVDALGSPDSPARFAVPMFGGRRGHPLAMSAAGAAAVARSSAETPLREIVWGDAAAVVTLDASDSGVVRNLNTTDDVRAAEAWLRGGRVDSPPTAS